MLFQWTDHSRRQAARRGLSHDELEYVLFHASHYHRAGAIIYYLREDDLPVADRNQAYACRLVGTAVVMARDRRTIITVWRNRQSGLNHILRKLERDHLSGNYWE
jgi:hypothetical protein